MFYVIFLGPLESSQLFPLYGAPGCIWRIYKSGQIHSLFRDFSGYLSSMFCKVYFRVNMELQYVFASLFDHKSLTVTIFLTEDTLSDSALWHTVRWTRHGINQYHISLWDIKCFVVHCHALLLWSPLYNTSTFPGSRNREQNQQNKYFTCYVTVCNASNSPMCPKDNKSGENY